MEKTIALRNTDITFSIWDLGGQQEYLHMLPLVCNDAVITASATVPCLGVMYFCDAMYIAGSIVVYVRFVT